MQFGSCLDGTGGGTHWLIAGCCWTATSTWLLRPLFSARVGLGEGVCDARCRKIRWEVVSSPQQWPTLVVFKVGRGVQRVLVGCERPTSLSGRGLGSERRLCKRQEGEGKPVQ
jgi:hypothetical protein